MKTVSIFNNKGGVGKTTLSFHLACALSEIGKKTLLIDLDPQCSLTIHAMQQDELHQIWLDEDDFIDDYQSARDSISPDKFKEIYSSIRSAHFILKPTEDGIDEAGLSKPYRINNLLDLIPGRLSLHLFENKIASRWSECYQGDPQAIRTITRIRKLSEQYSDTHGYEYIIIDTSPSLSILNKIIISTTDGFIIPCMPDMFSLYGIKNIGKSLSLWKQEFDTIFHLISDAKRKHFPEQFVRFLGFTIYNAKKYSTKKNPWDLATAHYNYAQKIPDTIKKYIKNEIRDHLPLNLLKEPIGGDSIIHSHSTLPSMAQKYRTPMWLVPYSNNLSPGDRSTVSGNRALYEDTKKKYIKFAKDVLRRIETLEQSHG